MDCSDGEDDGMMRRPSIGAGVVAGKLASGARRMSRTLSDTARRLSGSGQNTGSESDDCSNDDEKEDEALANQGVGRAMRSTLLLALVLVVVLFVLLEAQQVTQRTSFPQPVSLADARAVAATAEPLKRVTLAPSRATPPDDTEDLAAAFRGGNVEDAVVGEQHPQSVLDGHPSGHRAMLKTGTVFPDDVAFAVQAAEEDTREAHRKIVALQFKQYASGMPVQKACRSIGNMHLLAALALGQSVKVACPPGCEANLQATRGSSGEPTFASARLWGNNKQGYYEESLVCIAALHAFETPRPSPGAAYKLTVIHSMAGFSTNSSFGIVSGTHAQAGRGFVLNLINPEDEELPGALTREGNGVDTATDSQLPDIDVPDGHPPIEMPPVLSTEMGMLRDRVEQLYDVPLDLSDIHQAIQSKRALQDMARVTDVDLEKMHAFYVANWGRTDL